MRLARCVGLLLGGVITLNLAGCRFKAKRHTLPKSSASVVTVASADAGTFGPNESHFQPAPVNIGEYSILRARSLAAIKASASDKTASNETMLALAQALMNAPGSAVLAIELAKAAARAHDERRFQRYLQIARPLAAAQPRLEKMLGELSADSHSKATAKPDDKTNALPAGAGPAQTLATVANLDAVCGWLKNAFAQGRPPVADVGLQGTGSIDCRLLSPFALTPEILAAVVVAAARGQGERSFAWVAAKYKSDVWLTRSLVETFAPPFYPQGNGFSIELQRTATYRGGLPELTAYINERRTVIDVALNEQTVSDQHRIVVMTFDTDPPQTSASVLLHSRMELKLVRRQRQIAPQGLPAFTRHWPHRGTVLSASMGR